MTANDHDRATEHFMEQYPAEIALLTDFCEKFPDILPLRRARSAIDQINTGTATPELSKVFRKRFGRWHVHVPSLVAYMLNDDPHIDEGQPQQ